MQRTLWIHAGTHKTGTSSLQLALAQNRGRLLRAGLCYPVAGCGLDVDGRPSSLHDVVFRELLGFTDAADGNNGLDAALAEVAASGAPAGCISAEAFGVLSHVPHALISLRDRIKAAGFVPRIVFFLRPHADYLESLYAQLLRRDMKDDFTTFLATALRDGEIVLRREGIPRAWVIDYARLLATYAAIFGSENIVPRAYRSDRADAWVVDDFLRAIGITVETPLAIPPRINPRISEDLAAALLTMNRANAREVPQPRSSARSSPTFAALRLHHLAAITIRTAASSARVWARYRVRITPISAKRLRAFFPSPSSG